MNKKIIIILILSLFMTGCSCQYNLAINNNTYKEEIKLIGENTEEITNLNNTWEIPIDKEEFNRPGDPDSKPSTSNGTYNYNLSNNTLTLSNDFNQNNYRNSSAVSVCYKQLTIQEYNESTIISTSNDVECFERYPTLKSIIINVTVDRPVKSNNADKVSNNTYTWNISKNSKKAINLVLDNGSNSSVDNNSNVNNNQDKIDNNQSNNSSDYTLYIFLIILLILLLIGYLIFDNMKHKSDKMNDI